MRISPLDIHEQTFRMAFRGFDAGEVDSFLQRVADELERVIDERDKLRSELESERRTKKALEETLATARTLQDSVLATARKQAELLESQAQVRSDRILARANEELVRFRREVQELTEKRSLWLAELCALTKTLDGWISEKRARTVEAPALIADPEEKARAPEPPADGAEGEAP